MSPPPTSPRRSHSPTIDDNNICSARDLLCPSKLICEYPLNTELKFFIAGTREAAAKILHGEDDRLIVIAGPCSIHDPVAALQYAGLLKTVASQLQDDILVIMRTYFEKPRSVRGWKGLVNDPHLDGSFEINVGLRVGRGLLRDINSLGLPIAVEQLDTMTPQYFSDLTTWAAIGARTTESQLHRELASGLSMPVGFKNLTSGNVQAAVDACSCSRLPHAFLGVSKKGVPAVLRSKGNSDVHVILRGGATGTNFEPASIQSTAAALNAASVRTKIIVDCSHGNSEKDFRKQKVALQSVIDQITNGDTMIGGVMIESNIHEGSQKFPDDSVLDELRMRRMDGAIQENGGIPPGEMKEQDKSVLSLLRYGVSVTDGCVGWEETVGMLNSLAEAVRIRRSMAKH